MKKQIIVFSGLLVLASGLHGLNPQEQAFLRNVDSNLTQAAQSFLQCTAATSSQSIIQWDNANAKWFNAYNAAKKFVEEGTGYFSGLPTKLDQSFSVAKMMNGSLSNKIALMTSGSKVTSVAIGQLQLDYNALMNAINFDPVETKYEAKRNRINAILYNLGIIFNHIMSLAKTKM